MSKQKLSIINARENNLKGVTLDIEHDTLTVLTGLSGSGKSSLAFDTVYAEGQRRYIETFSPYTRQFFDKVKKPDVDLIENIRPAIAIQQRTRVTNSRSTVGSMTNLNEYLKVLWSNLAEPYCPTCGAKVVRWDGASLAAHLLDRYRESGRGVSRVLIAANVTLPIKGKATTQVRREVERLITLGYSRYFDSASGSVESFEDNLTPRIDANKRLVVVLDRFCPGDAEEVRLRDSIDQAFMLSNQSGGNPSCVILEQDDSNQSQQFTYYNSYTCQHCGTALDRPRPALFSFNHPLGACPVCKGFGRVLSIEPNRCVPDASLSIREKAVQCWSGDGSRAEFNRLLRFCEAKGISVDTPWQQLPKEDREQILNAKSKQYLGVLPWFKRLEKKIYKMHVRVFLAKYRGQFICPACHGSRLRPVALAYQIDEKRLPDLWSMPARELREWIAKLSVDPKRVRTSVRELKEVLNAVMLRLQYLEDLGLGYLSLDRQARTLSGGETQRVNLAAALGSDLISTHFVLDEPSVGLHSRDTERLISSIRKLQERGNSLLVVEHDLSCIAEADRILEVGPKAGEEGGRIVFNGPVSSWQGIPLPELHSNAPLPQRSDRALSVRNANIRNLKNISLRIPLQRLVCLSGVSGSGKSTLIDEVLRPAYQHYKGELLVEEAREGTLQPLAQVEGFEQISQVLLVDQSPLAKSPRGNIATYSGIWDYIRELLAHTDDALSRALSKSAFSFNVDGGRCPVCKGAGFIREDMQFLSDVFIPCEVCLGKRFQPAVLEVKFQGNNAHDFLQMSVERCENLFRGYPQIARPCRTLINLGLGHLTLGHPLSELSGGEAQRLKLVPFIEQSQGSESLLIFDEPTTGLHLHDVARLIDLFRLLQKHGHSILCVEHNLSVLAAADWIIDLGPESGEAGGSVVAEGSPLDLIANPPKESHTSRYLKEYIAWASTHDIFKPNGLQKGARLPAKKELRDTALTIKGAREHNLKNIDVAIPLNTFVALTGVSGSGKSSIAKDIIYAEGQRRYLDCLSPYARQFIKELKKPEIEQIKNIPPTICVYQHTFQPSRLSTVGTMSEIYNFLRLLYAKTGTQYCPDHPDQAISPMSPESIAAEIKQMRDKSIRILAPVIKKKKGTHREVLERAIKSEINQIRVDGVFLSPSSVSMSGGLAKSKAHSIDFTIAKFNPANLDKGLIEEAVTQALPLGGGTLIVIGETKEVVYSLERTCPICKTGFFKPDPEDLSFSSKRGQCPECLGTGRVKEDLPCPECHGARINAVGRSLRIAGKNIFEASLLTPPALSDFLKHIEFSSIKRAIGEPILNELLAKIETLEQMGLEYIETNRDCATLSGGELQRLRLATAMGSPLTSVLYIFDEPSVGLHPLDNRKVLSKLRTLQARGNSVLMIEHDAESILSADYVIDVGPGGGREGGEIVFSGSQDEFRSSISSPTAVAMRQEDGRTAAYASASEKKILTIKNGSKNNIKKLSLEIPLERLVTVAGVSGAGKSSLVHGIICQTILEGKANGATEWRRRETALSSNEPIQRVLLVDQKPIGINSRSTPASYLGVWDEIRKLFAGTVDARARGWKTGHFSYNTGKGRCPECKGLGQIKLEMSFLPDAFVECEVCIGRRFTEEAQSVRYLDRSISEVLNLTFEEARAVFAHHRKIHQPLQQACELGLAYLTLGQSSATLSGGESQRLKLVYELSARRKGHTLYVLDEPTTGLHKIDVARLITTLKSLVALGNTVLLIEHDQDVLKASDYVIEMGPGPGMHGGTVIFAGTPSDLLAATTPWSQVLSQPIHLISCDQHPPRRTSASARRSNALL